MTACYSQEYVYKYKPAQREQIKEYRYPSVQSAYNLRNLEPAPIHEETSQEQAAPVAVAAHHEPALSSQSVQHYQLGQQESQSQESNGDYNEQPVAYQHYYPNQEHIRSQQSNNYIQSQQYAAVSHEAPSVHVPSDGEAQYIRVPAHRYQYQEPEHKEPVRQELDSHSHDEPIDYYVSYSHLNRKFTDGYPLFKLRKSNFLLMYSYHA